MHLRTESLEETGGYEPKNDVNGTERPVSAYPFLFYLYVTTRLLYNHLYLSQLYSHSASLILILLYTCTGKQFQTLSLPHFRSILLSLRLRHKRLGATVSPGIVARHQCCGHRARIAHRGVCLMHAPAALSIPDKFYSHVQTLLSSLPQGLRRL